MISNIFNTLIYDPMYNGLIFLTHIIPGGDAGIAIILLTILVKLLLFPLSQKSIKSQVELKKLEPEIRGIRERYKENKQEQARLTMELYKKHDINPFSGCATIFMQLPVILGLYWVFYRGLPEADPTILYSSIAHIVDPSRLNVLFLGIVDITGKSLALALLAGVTQYFQMQFALSQTTRLDKKEASKETSFQEEFAKNMAFQMKYILPIIVVFISYSISAAIALYWITSNLFALAQELVVRKRLQKTRVA